jgi:hypothetical protein
MKPLNVLVRTTTPRSASGIIMSCVFIPSVAPPWETTPAPFRSESCQPRPYPESCR